MLLHFFWRQNDELINKQTINFCGISADWQVAASTAVWSVASSFYASSQTPIVCDQLSLFTCKIL